MTRSTDAGRRSTMDGTDPSDPAPHTGAGSLPCRICGLEPGTRHGRCNTCRSYHRAHPDAERPYELICRQLQREAARRR